MGTKYTPMEKAEATVTKLKTALRRAEKRRKTLSRDLDAAEWTVIRERAKTLIGKQVKHDTLVASSDKYAWANNAVGVLESVGRKYCVVDYGDHGRVRMLIRSVIPANEKCTAISMDAMMDSSVADDWFATTGE